MCAHKLGFYPRDPGTLDLGPVSCVSVVLPRGCQVSGAWDLSNQLLPPSLLPLVLAAQCHPQARGQGMPAVGCD